MHDVLPPVEETRCPHCRAAVRPGAPWCTLCHADLRPAPEPEPVVVAAPEPVLDPLTAPAAALGLPSAAPAGAPATAGWPCSRCGLSNAITEPVCTACGSAFLAGLRDTEAPLLLVPGVGDLTKLSRGQRLGLAAGVVVAFVLVTLVLGLLFS